MLIVWGCLARYSGVLCGPDAVEAVPPQSVDDAVLLAAAVGLGGGAALQQRQKLLELHWTALPPSGEGAQAVVQLGLVQRPAVGSALLHGGRGEVLRTEERRVGNELIRQDRSRWSPLP